jgi:hypothetical protein
MTTNAMFRDRSSSRWYDPSTGEPKHTVTAKSGSPRPTTLADARKLGLVPSVTTILRCLDKPSLNSWIREQAVLAALTTPRVEGEELDAFVSRVLSVDAEQEAQKARDFGILIHNQIERALNGHDIVTETGPFVEPVLSILKDFGRVVATEKIVFGKGYAGTLDALLQNKDLLLVDIKTTKAKVLPKESYPEHQLQLSAYAAALEDTGDDQIRTANIYVSSVRPGEVNMCENSDWSYTFDQGFMPILQYWQWSNDYRPQVDVFNDLESSGSEKIYGATHRETDGETTAYMENGRIWISDGRGGWLRCDPGVEKVFSPNEKHPKTEP